jgi:hypothetical protein
LFASKVGCNRRAQPTQTFDGTNSPGERIVMKVVILTSLFLLVSISLFAQETSVWERVYTFDDSMIEMNTGLLTYGGKNIARVRFRWTFDQLENLNVDARLKYKSQLEVIEFNCTDKRYRPYEITYFDGQGNSLRKDEMNPPVEWRTVGYSSMGDKLFAAGCELIERKTRPPADTSQATEFEKVAKFALSFSEDLEQTKDFTPIIQRFFVPDYLGGYLHDQDTNWFLNLNRATAENASPAELQRFYVASLNAGYLSCLYFISRSPAEGTTLDRKLVPSDVIEFIDHHSYTAAYKGKQANYDYIAENIDTVDRLRSYTNLLEGVAALMRKHVISLRAERSREYRDMLDDWDWTFQLYQPKIRACASECFGLPKGTKLYEINVPLFHLQVTEIKGELKIVSAIDYFR